MVKLSKSILPEGIRIKSKNDYQTGPVFQTLCEDCYGKCYICEHIPIPPVVEHIIAHKRNRDLKLDWNNLLLACSYCNTVKNKREFDEGIINPVEIDPEDLILFELSYDDFGLENVVIRHKCDSEDKSLADKTVKLLNLVYNNKSKRDNQKVSSANLRDMLSREISSFYTLVDNYKAERNFGDYQVVIEEISRSSEFAAFKRKIVRDDPELSKVFADSLV